MQKITKRIPKSAELMWVLGIFTVALGVALCKKADLGVSMIAAPAFIVFEALSSVWNWLTVGMTEYIIQGLLIIVLCAVVQRIDWRYLTAFLTAVIYGYVLDMWFLLLGNEPFSELYLRWIMLIVGDVITGLGVACFFRTYMPLQAYELFVAEVADRYKFAVNKTKWVYDISSFVLSAILALTIFGDVTTFDWSKIYETGFHSIGLGTIVTTIINAPIITAWGKGIDKIFDYTPLFPKFRNLLERKKRTKDESEEMNNVDSGINNI